MRISVIYLDFSSVDFFKSLDYLLWTTAILFGRPAVCLADEVRPVTGAILPAAIFHQEPKWPHFAALVTWKKLFLVFLLGGSVSERSERRTICLLQHTQTLH